MRNANGYYAGLEIGSWVTENLELGYQGYLGRIT